MTALRPERRDDVGGPRAPIEAGEHRLVDLQRIHQRDDIEGKRRLLAVAHRIGREKPRRAVAAQPGHDDPVAGLRQQRNDIDEAVDVVGPAVQEDDGGTVGGTGFGIADIENASVDLLQRGKRGMSARPRLARARLCKHGIAQDEWGRRQRHGGCAQKAAAVGVGKQGHGLRSDFYLMRLDRVRYKWFASRGVNTSGSIVCGVDQPARSRSRVETLMHRFDRENRRPLIRPIQAGSPCTDALEISASFSPVPRMVRMALRCRARPHFRGCGRGGRRRTAWRAPAAHGSRRRTRAG